MTGYQSKKKAARDKLDDDDTQVYQDHDDALTIAYQSGFYDGKKAAAQEPVTWAGVDFDINTTPPQRPWVDLTDEEITKTYWSREPFKRPTPIGFAREIEQLLKEKNT